MKKFVILCLYVVPVFMERCEYDGFGFGHRINILNWENYAHKFICRSVSNTTNIINLSDNYNQVDIVDSDIETIKYNIFSVASRRLIVYLSINNSFVNEIEPNAFNGFKNIRRIDLTFSNITSLNKNRFTDIKTLIFLNLSHNNIDGVKSEYFRGSPLQLLDLSHNKLTIMNESSFSNLPDLKTLYLNNNNISSVSNINMNLFHGTENLTALNVSWNHITKLESYFLAQLKKLEEFDISHNDVSKLDENTFKTCQNIRMLNISWNSITEIPNSLFEHLNFLTELDISHNEISKLDKNTFQTCQNIRMLNISWNSITEIPNSLFGHQHFLTVLDISYNTITTLNFDSFQGLNSLTTLDLSWNKIKDIPEMIFYNTPVLNTLSINNNFLQKIEPREFGKDTKLLRRIDINNNYITCSELINTLRVFKNMGVVVESGYEKNALSIHGIPCNESTDVIFENNLSKVPVDGAHRQFLDAIKEIIVEIKDTNNESSHNFKTDNRSLENNSSNFHHSILIVLIMIMLTLIIMLVFVIIYVLNVYNKYRNKSNPYSVKKYVKDADEIESIM